MAPETETTLSHKVAVMKNLARIAPFGKVKEELRALEEIRNQIEMALLGPAFLYDGKKYKAQKEEYHRILRELDAIERPLFVRLSQAA